MLINDLKNIINTYILNFNYFVDNKTNISSTSFSLYNTTSINPSYSDSISNFNFNSNISINNTRSKTKSDTRSKTKSDTRSTKTKKK